MADPYKKATINSVFGSPTKPKGVTAADLGKGSQSYSERKAKGRVELSTWIPEEVGTQMHELMERFQMKRPRDLLVKLIGDAHKAEMGG